MLVLSRKTGEQVCIDEHILIKVLEVRGNYIRLGVEAPADVPIRRAELPRPVPSPASTSCPAPVPILVNGG